MEVGGGWAGGGEVEPRYQEGSIPSLSSTAEAAGGGACSATRYSGSSIAPPHPTPVQDFPRAGRGAPGAPWGPSAPWKEVRGAGAASAEGAPHRASQAASTVRERRGALASWWWWCCSLQLVGDGGLLVVLGVVVEEVKDDAVVVVEVTLP